MEPRHLSEHITDALTERGWPRNLRLPQFRPGHRLSGHWPANAVLSRATTLPERENRHLSGSMSAWADN